jgi:hypothetical protein
MAEEPQYFSNDVLSRDAILGYAAEPFPVEAFGGTVYVRPLSGRDRDAYEMQNLKQTRSGTKLDLRNARARLAVLCLVERDQNGNWVRMFGNPDVERVGQLPAAELDKVTEAAREASGLDAEDEAAADFELEDPEPSGADSSSDLQAISA